MLSPPLQPPLQPPFTHSPRLLRTEADVLEYLRTLDASALPLSVGLAGPSAVEVVEITDGNLMFHVEKKGLSNTEAVVDVSRRLNISALKIRKLKESERK